MKRRNIFIIAGFLGVTLIVLLLAFMVKGAVPPTTTLSPTISPSDISPELQKEKEAQESYAEERARFLEEKPWLLKLPLKSNSYFISYDPEQNEFLVTLYFSTASDISTEEQLNQAKQESLNALKTLGVIIEKEKIVFFETEKK